jgi:hypothetical protein
VQPLSPRAPLELFNRLGDGHQWYCRTCFAAYFRARGDVHRDQSKAAKRARIRSLQAHVLEYLRGHPCVDCGESDPVVLEFDHVGDKIANICALVSDGAPLKTVDAEIARCEVVCANCHRRRTGQRAGWRRVDPDNPSRPYATRSIARNFAHLHAVLARGACVDCGERDSVVLEFDHLRDKRDAVTRLAWHGCSLATIDAEIDKCQIRCANCHRRATASRAGHFRFRVLSSPMPP